MSPTSTSHWAAELIGKPWRAGADGPDAFDCRGLVRHVWRTRCGMDVPPLAPEIRDDAAAIIRAAIDHGWQVVGRGLAVRAHEFDIVLMSSLDGPHVGVMVRADGRLGLLHCVGGIAGGVERGEVIWSRDLQMVPGMGYGRFEFWRRVT